MSTTTHDPTHTCKHMLTRKVLKESDEPGMVALACNSTPGKEAEGGMLRQENYHKLEVRQDYVVHTRQANPSLAHVPATRPTQLWGLSAGES